MFTFQKNWSVGFESTLRADEDEDDRGQEATQHEERFVKVDWPARAQGSHGLVRVRVRVRVRVSRHAHRARTAWWAVIPMTDD